MTTKHYLSIIIPVYNEEKNVAELHARVLKACKKIKKTFEVIFINDGSTDSTLDQLKKLKPITIINFRKNFGQTAAMDAGFKQAKGEILITMDGDLQNDPQDISKLLKKLGEGCDVVSGWRKNRQDPFMKNFISRGANLLRKFFVDDGIHDSGCSLKVYRRECFETVDLYGEMHRFVPAILKWQGFKIGEVVVSHHPRQNGVTKYNWRRVVKGFVDMIAIWFWRKYSNRPLHLFGSLGILFIFIGVFMGSYALYLKFFQNIDLSNTALTLGSMFIFLTGVILFAVGLLADIIVKTYFATSKAHPYLIKGIITNK